jgi:hypothetical protein
MSGVTHRPVLLLAVLIYVTLDLSLPAMPGVFVFEASESIESTQSRARAATEAVVLPAPVRDAFVRSRPPLEVKDRLTSTGSVAPRVDAVMGWRLRAPHDPAPPSEDPH